jgi:hypothetical protein
MASWKGGEQRSSHFRNFEVTENNPAGVWATPGKRVVVERLCGSGPLFSARSEYDSHCKITWLMDGKKVVFYQIKEEKVSNDKNPELNIYVLEDAESIMKNLERTR